MVFSRPGLSARSYTTSVGTNHKILELQKKNFEAPDEVKSPFEKGRIESVQLGGLTFSRETLEPGWKWSEHVKAGAGTDSC